MARGRPAKGPGLVEDFEGSEDAKSRMKLILETIAGHKSVEEACSELGLSKSMFHEIRMGSLTAALESLEAKPKGRPRQEVSEEQREIERLKKENEELKMSLQVAHVREELALVMPEVLVEADEKKKRMERRKKRRRQLKNKRKRAQGR
jgi:hypothetical protein